MTPVKRRNRSTTDRQREVLAVVLALRDEGKDVSAVAIGERMDIGRMAAANHLRSLERQGLMRDIPKVVSSGKWELTEQGRALLEPK